MNRRLAALAVAAAVTWTLAPALAQEPPPGGPDPQAPAPEAGFRGLRDPEIRPYDRVITKDAVTDTGVFTVHRIKDRLFYEIPKDKLGKEFLWVSQIAKTTLGVGYGGQALGNRVVKWERRGDRILLRSVSYEVVADDAPVRSRERSRPPTTTHPHGVQHRRPRPERRAGDRRDAPLHQRRAGIQRPHAGGRAHASTRHARSSNARSRSPRTSRSKRRRPTTRRPICRRRGAAPPRADAAARRSGPAAPASSMHFSMVLLPEKPMTPRLFDERVGYFSVEADGLRPGRAPRAGAPLHHPLPPREERPVGRALRAGEADRLLDRSGDAGEVGALPQARRRELAERRSKPPGSRTRSWPRKRRRPSRIPTGVRRTRATR